MLKLSTFKMYIYILKLLWLFNKLHNCFPPQKFIHFENDNKNSPGKREYSNHFNFVNELYRTMKGLIPSRWLCSGWAVMVNLWIELILYACSKDWYSHFSREIQNNSYLFLISNGKKREKMMKVITSGRPFSFGHDSAVSIFIECGELKASLFCSYSTTFKTKNMESVLLPIPKY